MTLKPKKKIKTSSAKSKGRELQQWICKRIAVITGLTYDQQDDQCPIHSREMGQSGVDVILREPALSLFPFSIECKRTEKPNVLEAMRQAITNQTDKTDWLVVFRTSDMKEPAVVMTWKAFESMNIQILDR